MSNKQQKVKQRIYLDYASLTPVDPRVLKVMNEFSAPKYANPSSWYKEGVAAKEALLQARNEVASFLHAHADEIFFTSGGTEANNIAIQGLLDNVEKGHKPHIIISEIEHSSIKEAVMEMEKRGCEVTQVGVDENGLVDRDALKKSMKKNTVLVSVMMVNNEIGTLENIRDIAKLVRHARGQNVFPVLHTDAAQAGLFCDLNVEKLGVDLLTLDAGKMYGPRGTGVLFVKRRLRALMKSIVFGGGHENGLRSGTENLASIVGFAKALDLVGVEREKETKRISELKKMFAEGLMKIRSDIYTNGEADFTSPYILNISIPGIDNEFFVMQLDAAGIACSTKSSCLRDEDESYVLKAIGADSNTSVRFSFGRWTKKEDVVKVLGVIRKLLTKS